MVVKPIITLATKYTDDIVGFGVRKFVDNVLKVKKHFSWGKMYILSKQN